ncbi:interaptin-like [Uranotaenia lowii]|uniref:interaptin-like n=1 Tax=Uranotaenia lowii TaxID=190385 RepID=UPI00247872BF|nr:interaptin-like [Uranotaenia lowii]
MEIVHLEDEELAFELALRKVKESKGQDRAVKLANLQKALDKEIKSGEIATTATHFMTDVDNIYQCQAKIPIILNLVESAIRQETPEVLKKGRSRLLHYRYRLSLIQDKLITANASKSIAKVEVALTKIDDFLKGQASKTVLTGEDQEILPSEKDILDRLKNSKLQSSIKEAALQNDVPVNEEHLRNQHQHLQEQQPFLPGQDDHRERMYREQQLREELKREQQLRAQLQLKLEQQKLENEQKDQVQRERERLLEQRVIHRQEQQGQPLQWDHQIRERSAVHQIHQKSSDSAAYIPPNPFQISQLELQHQFQTLLQQKQQQFEQFMQLQQEFEKLQKTLAKEQEKRENLERLLQQQRNHPYETWGRTEQPLWQSEGNVGTTQQNRPNDNQYFQKFSQPVYKWKMEYAGENNIRKLGEFLNDVKVYAWTEGVDDVTLLRSVKHLLRGPAQQWYTRAYETFVSWDHFKTEIKREFLPPNYSEILKQDLYLRFQGVNETFTAFSSDLLANFEIIEPPMLETEKMFILKSHLNIDFVPKAAAAQVSTVSELVKVCKDFEVSRSYALKNRPINSQRPVWTRALNTSNPRPTVPNTYQQNPAYRPNFPRQHVNMVTAEAFRPRQERNQEEFNDVEPSQFESEFGQGAADISPTISEEVNALQSGIRTPYRPSRPADAPTDSEIQPNRIFSAPIVCWQCEKQGHTFLMCPNPKTYIFCFTCGKKGCTTRNCQTCQARWRQLAPDSPNVYPGNGYRENSQ